MGQTDSVAAGVDSSTMSREMALALEPVERTQNSKIVTVIVDD